MKIKKGLYQFSNAEVVKALQAVGKLPKDSKCEAFVRVPGGGDWSNTDLKINDEDKLQVRFVTPTW